MDHLFVDFFYVDTLTIINPKNSVLQQFLFSD